MNALQRVELGYYLSEAYWGKGIVTEAAKLMVKYFFSDFYTHQVNDGQPIVRVDCNIYSWNKGSGKRDQIILKRALLTFDNRESSRETGLYSWMLSTTSLVEERPSCGRHRVPAIERRVFSESVLLVIANKRISNSPHIVKTIHSIKESSTISLTG